MINSFVGRSSVGHLTSKRPVAYGPGSLRAIAGTVGELAIWPSRHWMRLPRCMLPSSSRPRLPGSWREDDDHLKQVMAQGYAHYRAIGTKDMRIRDIRFFPLDEHRVVAHVAWTATYARKDQSDVAIDCDVHYFVQKLDGEPHWPTGDRRRLPCRISLGDRVVRRARAFFFLDVQLGPDQLRMARSQWWLVASKLALLMGCGEASLRRGHGLLPWFFSLVEDRGGCALTGPTY